MNLEGVNAIQILELLIEKGIIKVSENEFHVYNKKK